MLAWSSAGAFTVLGGGLLAACGGDDDSATPSAGSSGPTSAGGSAETVQVTELLSTPGPTFTNGPGAVAEAMGFYADQGVELTTEYPGKSVLALQTLAGGSGTLASADAFALLVATAEDLDFRSIFLSSRGYAFGFAVNADSPIEEWSEDTLRGSKIGITEFSGGEVPVLRGALARLGLGEGQEGIEFVPIGAGGPETADAIESGSVDLIAASIFDFEVFKSAGVELRVITPDYIRDFPGHAFATTPELLDNERDALVRFLRAHAMGTVFLNANPEAAAEMAVEAAPASAEGIPIEVVTSFLTGYFSDGNAYAFDPEDPNYHRLGVQELEGYDDFQAFLIETGSEDDDGTTLTEAVDVSSIIDDSLIDDINDFDYAEIEAMAENA